MSYFTVGTGNGAKERSMRIRLVAAAGVAAVAMSAAAVKLVFRRQRRAVQRFGSRVGLGWVRCRAEDRDN